MNFNVFLYNIHNQHHNNYSTNSMVVDGKNEKFTLTSLLTTVDLPIFIDKTRIKRVQIYFSLVRENLTSYLSPILGQYAIKNTDFLTTFVSTFHLYTSNRFIHEFSVADKIEENGVASLELTLPVILNVYKAGKFSIEIFFPPVTTVFKNYWKRKYKIMIKAYKRLFIHNIRKFWQVQIFNKLKNHQILFALKKKPLPYDTLLDLTTGGSCNSDKFIVEPFALKGQDLLLLKRILKRF